MTQRQFFIDVPEEELAALQRSFESHMRATYGLGAEAVEKNIDGSYKSATVQMGWMFMESGYRAGLIAAAMSVTKAQAAEIKGETK